MLPKKTADIEKDAKARNSRIEQDFQLQKEAIARETNVRSLQQKAESIAEQSRRDLEAASRNQEKLEKEKADLAALGLALEQERATVESEKGVLEAEKTSLEEEVGQLEFREKIFSGSFAGLLITAMLSVFAAFRAGRSGKLENRKRELEIAKLEHELERLQGSGS